MKLWIGWVMVRLGLNLCVCVLSVCRAGGEREGEAGATGWRVAIPGRSSRKVS